MKPAIIGFLVGAIYVAGAVAAWRALRRAQLRYRGEYDNFEAFAVSVVWPSMIIVIGTCAVILGDAGIYDSAAREDKP